MSHLYRYKISLMVDGKHDNLFELIHTQQKHILKLILQVDVGVSEHI